MSPQPVITCHELSRDFGPVRAVDRLNISFLPGEVHAVIGENGAGKSTLMKMLAGLIQPNSGIICIDGKPTRLGGVHNALELGIAMIHQELNLIDELSVADNIMLGREFTGAGGLVRSRRTHAEARLQLARLDAAGIDPAMRVGCLSIAQKQLVEIAKALSCKARILIMDEPTAVLSERETSSLFSVVRQLRNEGATIIYISHILSEVRQLADRITVMRDGRLVTTITPGGVDDAGLARLMVGRELGDLYPPLNRPDAQIMLEVDDITVPGLVASASLTVHKSEIMGMAGLIGAGRTEFAEAITGLRQRQRGTVRIRGSTARIRNYRDSLRAGLAYLSEDRKARGLHLDMSIIDNTTIANLNACGGFFINSTRQRERTRVLTDQLKTRANRLTQPVRSLSGGNQQKVAIARWLDTSPDILILDEPTRGVDVGAKREIYFLIHDLAARGMTIIVISSELPELIGLCHRIKVMRNGRIVGEVLHEDATEEHLMRLAAGVDDLPAPNHAPSGENPNHP